MENTDVAFEIRPLPFVSIANLTPDARRQVCVVLLGLSAVEGKLMQSDFDGRQDQGYPEDEWKSTRLKMGKVIT